MIRSSGAILVDIYRHLASVAPADQQEPLAVRALELARKTLGPEHPSVAAALGDLGGVQRARGRRVEALDTFQRATVLGDHSNTAMALRNVGITLFELGRYDEAIAAISEVVRISAHVDADPFVGFEAHIVLGDALRRTGRPQEARAALDRAAAVARDHPELAAGIAAVLDVMHLVRARTLLDAVTRAPPSTSSPRSAPASPPSSSRTPAPSGPASPPAATRPSPP